MLTSVATSEECASSGGSSLPAAPANATTPTRLTAMVPAAEPAGLGWLRAYEPSLVAARVRARGRLCRPGRAGRPAAAGRADTAFPLSGRDAKLLPCGKTTSLSNRDYLRASAHRAPSAARRSADLLSGAAARPSGCECQPCPRPPREWRKVVGFAAQVSQFAPLTADHQPVRATHRGSSGQTLRRRFPPAAPSPAPLWASARNGSGSHARTAGVP